MAMIEVKVPDIGDFTDVPIIEVLVKAGDVVSAEDSLVTLESEKATMDVPAPAAGTIRDLRVKAGDKVSEGSVLLTMDSGAAAPATATSATTASTAPSPAAATVATPPSAASARSTASAPAPAAASSAASTSVAAPAPAVASPVAEAVDPDAFKGAHASPSVRKFARELGVDLTKVKGSAAKERIVHEDVKAFVKQTMSRPAPAPAATSGGGLNLLPWPKVDFARYGPVELTPLSRIQKYSGANLARNWVMIPHVTQFDEADITELEAFRVQLNKEVEKSGVRMTMLAYLIKACVAALTKFPEFNASLDGENLVLKRYFHIGFAADTPNGLVVPVIRNADQKGVQAIGREMAELSAKARDGKLTPTEMQGGCFSISSLGGIGGTAFTPIINAPEVAILGVSRSQNRPMWNGKEFVPRLMLPLSLSYDHRVIDGATAARFTTHLAGLLADMRRTLL